MANGSTFPQYCVPEFKQFPISQNVQCPLALMFNMVDILSLASVLMAVIHQCVNISARAVMNGDRLYKVSWPSQEKETWGLCTPRVHGVDFCLTVAVLFSSSIQNLSSAFNTSPLHRVLSLLLRTQSGAWSKTDVHSSRMRRQFSHSSTCFQMGLTWIKCVTVARLAGNYGWTPHTAAGKRTTNTSSKTLSLQLFHSHGPRDHETI